MKGRTLLAQTLVTGGDGMVGSYIDFGIRTNHHSLDVTNLAEVVKKCEQEKPKIILHLAASNDLARCEQDPWYAYSVNSVGTYNLALAAQSISAKLVYVSTSGVFDGTKKDSYTEADIPNPVNVFGHSKYLGELAVQSILDNFLIVRTSWVFGGGKDKDKKFVGKILKQLEATEIHAVADRRGSPTFAKDLARGIAQLLEEKRRGIVHLSGGSATRFEVASEIVAITGSSAKVVPARAADFPSAYESGENESMQRSPLMRPWQEALAEYLQKEWKMTHSRKELL